MLPIFWTFDIRSHRLLKVTHFHPLTFSREYFYEGIDSIIYVQWQAFDNIFRNVAVCSIYTLKVLSNVKLKTVCAKTKNKRNDLKTKSVLGTITNKISVRPITKLLSNFYWNYKLFRWCIINDQKWIVSILDCMAPFGQLRPLKCSFVFSEAFLLCSESLKWSAL